MTVFVIIFRNSLLRYDKCSRVIAAWSSTDRFCSLVSVGQHPLSSVHMPPEVQ